MFKSVICIIITVNLFNLPYLPCSLLWNVSGFKSWTDCTNISLTSKTKSVSLFRTGPVLIDKTSLHSNICFLKLQ